MSVVCVCRRVSCGVHFNVIAAAEFQSKRVQVLEEEYRRDLEGLRVEFDKERCVKKVHGLP